MASARDAPETASAWLQCAWTSERMHDVDDALDAVGERNDPRLRPAIRHLVAAGGKRIRPALLLLCSRLGEPDRRRVVDVAAAVELFHVATLYHDDVLDAGTLRRGVDSVNARWGEQIATLTGSHLFARASELVAEPSGVALREFSAAADEVCAGQFRELENAFNTDLSVTAHLKTMGMKTAALFALPCRLGARLGGVDAQTVDMLNTFGRHLGQAFQIADDLLDFEQTDSSRDAALVDLRYGIYSLPVIAALHGARGAELSALLSAPTATLEDLAQAREVVRQSETRYPLLDLAQEHSRRAYNSIAGLPNDTVRETLIDLSHSILSRIHD